MVLVELVTVELVLRIPVVTVDVQMLLGDPSSQEILSWARNELALTVAGFLEGKADHPVNPVGRALLRDDQPRFQECLHEVDPEDPY